MAKDFAKAESMADELVETVDRKVMNQLWLEAKITRAECLVERESFDEALEIANAVGKEAVNGSISHLASLEKTRSKAVIGLCKHAAGEKEAGKKMVEAALQETRSYQFAEAFVWYENRLTEYLKKMEE